MQLHKFPSSAKGIHIDISGVKCSFIIANCDFQRNQDGHLQVVASDSTGTSIVIANSTFNTSTDDSIDAIMSEQKMQNSCPPK